MRSEWLKSKIENMINDYYKYLEKDNSLAGQRFRVAASEIIKELQKERSNIQLLRYYRNDRLLKYNIGHEKRREKILKNGSMKCLSTKELAYKRLKLSEKAQNRKNNASKKRDLSINKDDQSYDIF